MNEKLVAYQNIAELYSWRHTSASGCKATWRLANRDELAHFDKVTKRKGGKAGQRYMLVVADPATGEIYHQAEVWFMGGEWKHTVGALVAFQFEGFEAIQVYTTLPTADQYTTGGFEALVTLVQLDDEDNPIDQQKADLIESLKGGPKSKHAARLCKDPDFIEWVGQILGKATDEHGAAQLVRSKCGITTRAEFDHDQLAWTRFERLIEGPFIRWARREGRIS